MRALHVLTSNFIFCQNKYIKFYVILLGIICSHLKTLQERKSSHKVSSEGDGRKEDEDDGRKEEGRHFQFTSKANDDFFQNLKVFQG